MEPSEPHRGRVSRAAAQDDPRVIRRAFVDLMLTSKPAQLSPTQRVAYQAFWYDSAIRNGGHVPYLTAQPLEAIQQVIASLELLGADAQADLLREALERWRERERPPAGQTPSYLRGTVPGEGEFLDLDSFYAECQPAIPELLERYLDENFAEFIQYDEEN